MVEWDIYPTLKKSYITLYEHMGLVYTSPLKELESFDYEACHFALNHRNIMFRTAKITPAKMGAFVTLWKRSEKGVTTPITVDDPYDLFVICVQDRDHFGQFVFPKNILETNDILSNNVQQGKMGFRIYPSWVKPTSRQAIKTQKWQLCYFIDISHDIDINVVKRLYQT